jgi:uncharacterized cupredoxin-like copper-binding protein
LRKSTTARLVSCLAAALLLASCATSKVLRPPAPPDTDWSKAGTATVKLADFEFQPENLVLKARQPIRLVLVNTGSGEHDFSAPDFFSAVMYRPGSVVGAEGHIVVPEGQTKEVDIMPIAAGTYDLECTEFLHSLLGMSGKIAVTDDNGQSPLPLDK